MAGTLDYRGYLGTFLVVSNDKADTRKVDVYYLRSAHIALGVVEVKQPTLMYEITEPYIANTYDNRYVKTSTHYLKKSVEGRRVREIRKDIEQGLLDNGYRIALRDSIELMTISTANDRFTAELEKFIVER